jgi:hypothetical protein
LAASSTYYVGASGGSGASSAPVLSGYMQANLALQSGVGGPMQPQGLIPEPATWAAIAAACVFGLVLIVRSRRTAVVSTRG